MQKIATYLVTALAIIFSLASSSVQALSQTEINTLDNGTVWYDPTSSGGAACSSSSISSSPAANLDYAGRPILTPAQLQALSQNQSTYQQAASQAGIPWQVLAAIHYRETGFSLNAPSNGDGQYQIVKESYPTSGTITQQQFLQESIDAANFLKADGAGLTADSSQDVIKKAIGLYNGLPDLYAQQAVSLGFTADHAYEGSPYVMNFADAKRDPGVAAAGTWLQYLTSSSIGPATNQYGAFLVYASLTGGSVSGGCVSSLNCQGSADTTGLSTVRQNIVCAAQQELQKWDSGQLTPGAGYLTYSENRHEDWCADFASWVYNQAGHPLGPVDSPTKNWSVSYVPYLKSPPQDTSKFTTHSVSGYTPQPGDLAIHGDRHVNIVVGVAGSKVTFIGGNQKVNGFDLSSVSSYSNDATDSGDITEYVSPN